MFRIKLLTLLYRISCIISVISLFGCDFKPLLSQSLVIHNLNEIKINSIEDREGHRLKNILLDIMTPNRNGKFEYTLNIKLEKIRKEMSYSKSYSPRRAELGIEAKFFLYNVKNKCIFNGVAKAYNAYSIANTSEFAQFSSVVAEEKTNDRILKIIAENIRMQLASFFVSYNDK